MTRSDPANRFDSLPHIRERYEGRRPKYTAEGYWTGETLQQLARTAIDQRPAQSWTFSIRGQIVRTTLAELGGLAEEFSELLLRSAGCTSDDVVAVVLPNSPGAVTGFIGIHLAGLIAFPVSAREGHPSFAELRSRIDVAHVLVSEHDTDRLAELDRVASRDSVRHVWVCDDRGRIRLHSGAQSVTRADLAAATDGVHVLSCTSGSTSAPKVVLQTDSQLIFESRELADVFAPFGAMLVASPTGHIAGIQHLLVIPLLRDADIVSMDRWDPSLAVALAREFGAEALAGAPLYFQAMQAVDVTLGGIRGGVVGGGPVAPAVVESLDRRSGVRLVRCYGSTEHPTVTISLPGDQLVVRAHTDGRPGRGTEIRVIDEAGGDLPRSVSGELLIRGPDASAGYLEAEMHAASFDDDGWFHTGDVGTIDNEGLLTLTDRIKDIIIRGGENISAKEVEDALLGWTAVFDAVVVGVSDLVYGERGCAFITPAYPGAPVDLESMQRYLGSTGLEKFKWPEHVRVVEDLPRSASGKVNKQELRRTWSDA